MTKPFELVFGTGGGCVESRLSAVNPGRIELAVTCDACHEKETAIINAEQARVLADKLYELADYIDEIESVAY